MTNVLSKKYNSVNYHKRQFILWKLYIIFQFVLLVFNYVYISDLKLTNKRMDKNVPTFIWYICILNTFLNKFKKKY